MHAVTVFQVPNTIGAVRKFFPNIILPVINKIMASNHTLLTSSPLSNLEDEWAMSSVVNSHSIVGLIYVMLQS